MNPWPLFLTGLSLTAMTVRLWWEGELDRHDPVPAISVVIWALFLAVKCAQ